MKVAGFRASLALSLVALLVITLVVSAEEQCDAKSSKCELKAPVVDDTQDLIADSKSQVRAQFLFSTPLLRTHISAFVDNATAFNAALGKAVLKDYDDFLKSNKEEDPENRNDDFFAYQLGNPLDMTAEELEEISGRASQMHYRNTPQFATLRDAVSTLARHAARDVLRKRVAEDEYGNEGDEGNDSGEPISVDNFDAWAAVHFKRAQHAMHFHENSALSAVYYVSVPQGAGELTLYDPRGPRPPFEQTFTIHPEEGDLIMFPGWLGHSVGQTGDTGNVPRISIPFNGEGTWEQSSDVPPDEWSVPIDGDGSEEANYDSIPE